jgi:hypothetical protein
LEKLFSLKFFLFPVGDENCNVLQAKEQNPEGANGHSLKDAHDVFLSETMYE